MKNKNSIKQLYRGLRIKLCKKTVPSYHKLFLFWHTLKKNIYIALCHCVISEKKKLKNLTISFLVVLNIEGEYLKIIQITGLCIICT